MNQQDQTLVSEIDQKSKWNYVGIDRTNGQVYERNGDWELGWGPPYIPIGKLDLETVRSLEENNPSENIFFKDNFSNSISAGGTEWIH